MIKFLLGIVADPPINAGDGTPDRTRDMAIA